MAVPALGIALVLGHAVAPGSESRCAAVAGKVGSERRAGRRRPPAPGALGRRQALQGLGKQHAALDASGAGLMRAVTWALASLNTRNVRVPPWPVRGGGRADGDITRCLRLSRPSAGSARLASGHVTDVVGLPDGRGDEPYTASLLGLRGLDRLRPARRR